ncbi:MAG: ABC transporter permease, partial [Candidatus Rifleibacteriota bacterium]
MNFKAIFAIFTKDLRDGSKNYQIILMVLTPIILSLLFSNVITKSKAEAALPEIGIITSPKQPLINSMTEMGLGKKILFYKNRNELESAILEGKVRFGIILPDAISTRTEFASQSQVILLYPPHIPEFGVESLKSAFESEIRQKLNLTPPPLPFEFVTAAVSSSSTQSGSVTEGMFPMLIVMAMGMIG